LRGEESLKRRNEDREKLVLSALRELGGANISALRRKTNLNYYVLVRVLENLASRGFVVERRIGRLRVFTARSTGDQRTA
jgi:predicted transcriptional regulator